MGFKILDLNFSEKIVSGIGASRCVYLILSDMDRERETRKLSLIFVYFVCYNCLKPMSSYYHIFLSCVRSAKVISGKLARYTQV